MTSKGLNIVREATPIRGFVLEAETETKIALNKYTKIRGLNRLEVENISIFDQNELCEKVNGDVKVLNKIIKAFTKGKKYYIRESVSYLFKPLVEIEEEYDDNFCFLEDDELNSEI